MSMAFCPHCDTMYDQDFNVEHEEECADEQMEKHILTYNGLCDAQVCSEGTYDEALDFITTTNPAGTDNNWMKNEEDTFAPVQCDEHTERTHYMFKC